MQLLLDYRIPNETLLLYKMRINYIFTLYLLIILNDNRVNGMQYLINNQNYECVFNQLDVEILTEFLKHSTFLLSR